MKYLRKPRLLLFIFGLVIGLTLISYGVVENFDEIRMEASEL